MRRNLALTTKGTTYGKEIPAPPAPPQTYEQYFKICKEQYDIVEGSARAYATAVAVKPSSELPKKPDPVFTPPDESTLIRCSTEEDFELQIQRAKDGLIDSHIETIVHPSLRTIYSMKHQHRLNSYHEFGKPPTRSRYAPRRTPPDLDFSTDSEDEAASDKMDTVDDTNKRKSTDTVEPPAKR
jgi:hypothetical protein